ncbi:autotransporter outer membrane beta-barrel domain-containing protein [Campylobacter sp. RM9328]|uniref:autotransporter outer membrane beta-barrel domain-containing protein n=1 Tax=Campylobacter sp. RM9328 TaxID=1705720 RepID=UPI0014731D09|nr:autotransporter outer membrane beta-barrel domain-containing protein [Campylobacter sp. RM9328]
MANEIEQIGYTQNSKLLNELIVKTQNELKTIGESSNSQISGAILLSNNMFINQRLSHIKLAPKLTMQNAFKYALASGESDAEPSLAKVMQAIEADRARNSFWYNVGGGYIKENNGGDVKFYGTSLGYDKTYDLSSGSAIYGVMFGVNKAKYKNKSYEDLSKSYSVGVYADYESVNSHEFQSNLNLAYIRSDKNFMILNETQKAKNNGYGMLLSTYYKYCFDLPKNGTYNHSIKPVVLIEVGHNGVNAFASKHYKQDRIKNTNIALGLGAEYTIVSDNQAHTLQAILKKNVHQTNDSVKVNLSNANSYLEYDIKNKPLSYEVNYIGETRLNDKFVFQYAVGGTANAKGSYGTKASVKLEYKF